MADLDAQIDALFQLPVGEFVSARNQLAKAQTDKAEAKRIKAMAKPNAAAWALNQLMSRAPDLLAQMIEHADAYRAIQGAAMRGESGEVSIELAQRRRETHNALLAKALVALEESGKPASKATARLIATSLETLAAFGSAYDGTPVGRLSRELDPPGIEVMASLAQMAGLPVAAPAPAAAATDEPKDDGEDEEEEDEDEDEDEDDDSEGEAQRALRALAAQLGQAHRKAVIRQQAAAELVEDFVAKLEVARTMLTNAAEEVERIEAQLAEHGLDPEIVAALAADEEE